MRGIRRMAVAAGLGVTASLALASTASAATWYVNPGQKIQAAINKAAAGDTIVVRPGTYRENLLITKNGITLRGSGASGGGTVLKPAANPSPNICSEGDFVSGICILGEFDPATFEPGAPRRNVTVTAFKITGFTGEGVFAFNTYNLQLTHNLAAYNGGYGLFSLTGKEAKLLYNTAHHNGDPGLYVGDSPMSNAQIVGNRSYDNRSYGIFVRDTSGAWVLNNKTYGNCIGIFALDTGSPTPAANLTLRKNQVWKNNRVCPAGEEEPPLSGVGIALGGTTNSVVKENTIWANVPAGPSAWQGGITMFSTVGFGGSKPSGNVIRSNVLYNNDPDIMWDRTGTGNRFVDNKCSTSVPGGLC